MHGLVLLLRLSYRSILCANQNSLLFIKLYAISYKTSIKYLQKITTVVEKKIKNALPNKFCLVFDGCTSNTSDYIDIYARFTAQNELGYNHCLLGFGPYDYESSMNTEDLYRYIEFWLSVFGKNWENVVSLVECNCSMNKALANRVALPFVGCFSHRHNLGVQDIIRDNTEEICMVNEFMNRVKYFKLAAKSRTWTLLCFLLKTKRDVLRCNQFWKHILKSGIVLPKYRSRSQKSNDYYFI